MTHIKTLIATALLLFGSSTTFAQSPMPPNDKGWMAFFLGADCQLGRRVAGHRDRGTEMGIVIVGNPLEQHAPTLGRNMLSVLMFKGGKPLRDSALSITINAGDKEWKLTPSELDAHYIIGDPADAARALFVSDAVTVRVEQSGGITETFAVAPKGFKVANATFEACVTALSQEKPAKPAGR